jgi:hypothetical protein
MVFPLGVSVGDFISGIQLLRSTIKALNDARGARSNFQQLCASLESLETALALVAQLILTPDQASHKKAVVDAVGRCRQCADAFVEQIDRFEVLKFQTQSRWSLEKLGICLRKIQWSLLKKDDVDQFRADISAHTDALQMLMISFQM